MGILKERFVKARISKYVIGDCVFRPKKAESFSQLWNESSINLSHDVENPALQQLFDKASEAAQKLSTSAKRDLEKAFASKHPGERLSRVKEFLIVYRNQLTNLLGTTQLAALLEGMRQVAQDMPPIPPKGGPHPPPSLEPEEAKTLVESLAALPPPVRAQRIYELPADQQAYVRAAASSGGGAWKLPEPPTGHAGAIHFPKLEEAVKELAAKNVLPARDYYRLDDASRQKAFTVARVAETETLEKIRDALAEQVSEGADVPEARKRLIEAVGDGTFLSRPHLDTVIRNGIQGAFSDGQFGLLKHPGVRRGFPYAEIIPIHDDRVRPHHLEMGHRGLNGTGIYLVTDPTFQLWRPPSEWQCRCGVKLKSIRRAAEAGVEHAREWLRTGVEPPPEFVPMPPFRPDPTFRRQGVPLSIQLSMEPMELSWTSYHGTHGGEGWKSTVTGEVRYQQDKPSERDEGSPEQPTRQTQQTEMPNATITVEGGGQSKGGDHGGGSRSINTGSPEEAVPQMERRLAGIDQWAAKNGYDSNSIRDEIGRAYLDLVSAREAEPHRYSPASYEDIFDHVANQVLSSRVEAQRLAIRQAELDEWRAMKAEHLSKEIPNPPDLPKSAARVSVVSRQPMEKVQARVDKIFGKPTDIASMAALVGAPDDARVSVTPHREQNKITVRIQHPSYTAKRTIGLDYKGDLVIHNDEFFMKEGKGGQGLGAEIFAKQVQAAQEAGVKRIETHGAGKKGVGMNGYYTWPRFGYDQKLAYMAPDAFDYNRNLKYRVGQKFPQAETLSDVFLTKEGRDWWKENGSGIANMEFDLTPGSRSLRVLYGYLEERAKERAVGAKKLSMGEREEENDDWGDGYEHADLSRNDDAALDRIWDKIAKELEDEGSAQLAIGTSQWVAYVGKRGPNKGKPVGWQNSETGRIVYGERKPGKGDAEHREGRPTVSDVVAKAKKLLASQEAVPTEHLQGLLEDMAHMSLKDLAALKQQSGIRAGSGAKDKVKDAIVTHVKKQVDKGVSVREAEQAKAEKARVREESKAAKEKEKADKAKAGEEKKAGKGTVGKQPTFIPHPNQRPDETTIMVDTAKLENAWKDIDDEYIPPGGGGNEIGGRRANFKAFLAKGKPVESSRVTFGPDGKLSFIDGRHRFSVLRDMGVKKVGLTVPKAQAKEFEKRFGAKARTEEAANSKPPVAKPVETAPQKPQVIQQPNATITIEPATKTRPGKAAPAKSADRKGMEDYLLKTGFDQPDLDEMDDKELKANWTARQPVEQKPAPTPEPKPVSQPRPAEQPRDLPSALTAAVQAAPMTVRGRSGVATQPSDDIQDQLYALGGVDRRMFDDVYDRVRETGIYHGNNELFRSLSNRFDNLVKKAKASDNGKVSADEIGRSFAGMKQTFADAAKALHAIGDDKLAKFYGEQGAAVVDRAHEYALEHFGRSATPRERQRSIGESFDNLDRYGPTKGINQVSLVDLRKAHPELSREEFDKVLDDMRRSGQFTMSAVEGRHGVSKEEQESAIPEDGGQRLLYVSRRKG